MSFFNMIKSHVESLYDSTCTITQYQPTVGVVNNTSYVVTAENIPCRVMYKSILYTVESSTGSAVTRIIKLFLSPEIAVKAGSSVRVTKNGIETDYSCAGEAAVYISHQEIELKLKDRWA